MSPYIPRPGQPVGINPDWHLERPNSRSTTTPLPADVQQVSLPTAESTYQFGRDRLAPILKPGDLIIASGRLGAGKTVLVQGIGAGLRVVGRVLSPTFVIARVHRGGRLPLVHVDAYRLGSIEEIDDLDLDTELSRSVTVIEWGAGLVEQLTDEYLLIELSLAEDAGSLHNRPFDAPESSGSLHNRPLETDDVPRLARLTASGPRWQARLRTLDRP